MSGKRLFRASALVLALFLCDSAVRAGDIASFVDLGFSSDGRTYMFGQYGVQSKTLKPWAELFVVDVPANNFVSGGRLTFINETPVVSGQDGSGALYRLIAQNAPLADRYRINYCFQGQPLYIAIDSSPADAAGQAPVDFRDFNGGASYRATLVQNIEGSGANLKSSFYINLERTARDGAKKNYIVGTPQLKRPLIASYRIRKVVIAPYDGSMIFIVEMQKQNGVDTDIRYMVEAVRL